jgi:cysteine desulfurase
MPDVVGQLSAGRDDGKGCFAERRRPACAVAAASLPQICGWKPQPRAEQPRCATDESPFCGWLDLPLDLATKPTTAVTYLDHNATSPLLPPARAAWLDAEERFPGNPSSPHRVGARADAALGEARQRLAAIVGGSPDDIVWTSGATESCNTALQHAASTADASAVACISAVEHPAVRASAEHYFGDRVEFIPVDGRGRVELAWLERRVASRPPALVALMAANNETGVLQPWAEAREICAARGVTFFCDATQWCGRLPAKGLGACALVGGSAHKFGGPRGVGFLQCGSDLALRPLLRGGQQQDGRRAGTENVPGVLALVAALEWCESQIATGAHLARRAQRERFELDLQSALPGVRINGAGVDRLWNTVSAIMPESDCRQRWVVKLDKAGFAVSTGSACSSGMEHPSPVLTAMGLTPAETGRALRFSAGWLTTETEWSALLAAMIVIQREFQPSVAIRA